MEPHGETARRLGLVDIKRALISVSDKTDLIGLATVLASHEIELISTGGTAEALRKADFEVKDVSELTGFPEMMGGRLKTLHPMVHGPLLFRRDNEDDASKAASLGMKPIDLLVVNLYPFEKTVAEGKPFNECVENIDIGGPTMIRGAAKNFSHVAVVTSLGQYMLLANELGFHDGALTLAHRKQLMIEAFQLTAAYDAAIVDYVDRSINHEVYERRRTTSRDLCGND